MKNQNETLESYDLIQRLKDIHAILQRPTSSLIERYAGISELALFRDIQKVGVLTKGLLDLNDQVRNLSARVLGRDYGLSETSDAVLALLRDDAAELREIIDYEDYDRFSPLLDRLAHLLKTARPEKINDQVVDYQRRHVLRIISGLGPWARRIQALSGLEGAHPLKQLLEDQRHRSVLDLIEACLRNPDLFTRRLAIVVVGELNLSFGLNRRAYDIVMEAIDRRPDRDDYLVTRDGIEAIKAIAIQDSGERERCRQTLLNFYRDRRYNLPDFGTREAHRYYTCSDCVAALEALLDYEAIIECVRVGEEDDFLHMMRSDRLLKPSSGVKRAIITGLAKIYSLDGYQGDLSARQGAIIDHMSVWVGSRDRVVRAATIGFFSGLENKSQAIRFLHQIAERDSETIEEIVASLADGQAAPAGAEDDLKGLLEDRQQYITVFGTMFEAWDSGDDPAEVRARTFTLLRRWAFERFGGDAELRESRRARLESLWAIYIIGRDGETVLDEAELARLRQHDYDDPVFRAVLELIIARDRGADQLDYLRHVVASSDDDLVRACAEIELIDRIGGAQSEISEHLARFVVGAGRIGTASGIPYRIGARFLAELASIPTMRATDVIRRLMATLPSNLRPRLREQLSGYQCYQLRNDLTRMLLQDLTLRHKEADRLRLDYLNLLRAGQYKHRERRTDPLAFAPTTEDATVERVLAGLRAIRDEFKEQSLPIVPDSGRERVTSYAGLTPTTLTTTLYAVGDASATIPSLKAYVRTQQLNVDWCFLNSSLTDREIIEQMSDAPGVEARTQRGVKIYDNVRRSIAAQVEQVTDDGIIVNIGLRGLQPSVRRYLIAGNERITVEEWKRFAQNLEGAILSLRVRRLRLNEANQPLEVELIRDDVSADLVRPIEGSIAVGRVKGTHEPSQGLAGVVFDVDGVDRLVALEELSWRHNRDWIVGGWRNHFRQRVGDLCDLMYSGGHWSLRQNRPSLSAFVELLYEHGGEPFHLTFAEDTPFGYSFEIGPGKLCFVPADRLVRAQSYNTQFDFLLPDASLHPGDTFKVRFVEQVEAASTEVLLEVIDVMKNPTNHSIIRRDMRVVGTLDQINPNQRSATLTVSDPTLQEFTFTIRNLPLDGQGQKLSRGASVNGWVTDIDEYSMHVELRYALATPEDLELGQWYSCVVDDVRSGELRLHYANVSGLLRERDMSYAQEPAIPRFVPGQRLTARLVQPLKWGVESDQIVDGRPDQIMEELDRRNPFVGIATWFNRAQNKVSVEGDGTQLQFTIEELNLRGRAPAIFPGNRVKFTRDASGAVKLCVERARVNFTILPDLGKPADWKQMNDVLPNGRTIDCRFITRRANRQVLLCELQPGIVFAFPLGLIRGGTPWASEGDYKWRLNQHGDVERIGESDGEEELFALASGDALRLARDTDGVVRLLQYRPSPLSFAANPQRFEPNFTEPIPVVGHVVNLPSDKGIFVELKHLEYRGTNVPLRRGLLGFYHHNWMSEEHRDLFEAEQLEPGQEVTVLVSAHQPLDLRDGRLHVALRGIDSTSQQAPDVFTTIDRFYELIDAHQADPDRDYAGVITGYDLQRRAFRVALDWFPTGAKVDCWLPEEKVSYSLVRFYQSIDSFGGDTHKNFVILDINQDEATVALSLVDRPFLSIDTAAELLGWHHGLILNHVSFVELRTPSDEHPDASPEIGVEIKPGELVRIPLNRLSSDGMYFDYEMLDRAEPGDQLTLRVVERNDSITLDLVRLQAALLNLLANKRRIVHGRIDLRARERGKLDLLGFQVQAQLDPSLDFTPNELRDHDLYRFTQRVGHRLYYRPVYPKDLDPGDIVNVIYQKLSSDGSRIELTYGDKWPGILNRYDVSYRLSYDLSDFPRQPGDRFDAVVRNYMEDVREVLFELKGLGVRRLSTFLDRRIQSQYLHRHFNVVVVRKHSRALDLEVEAGLVVRVPYDRLEGLEELGMSAHALVDELIPGDTIRVRLIVQNQYVSLRVDGILKSLFHYLKQDMLVRARFRYRNHAQDWIFGLSDYDDLPGRLAGNERGPIHWLPGVLSDDLRLVVADLPSDPSRPVLLRQRRSNDAQLIMRVDRVEKRGVLLQGEDGLNAFLPSYLATHRVDNRTTYLEEWLKPNQQIMARRELIEGRARLSLISNEPAPLTMIGSRRECELTYVRQDGDDLVCELSPGKLLTIPLASLFFNEQQLSDVQRRMLPGDVIEGRILRASRETHEHPRIAVRRIRQSSLHRLQKDQLIEARVIEVSPQGLTLSMFDSLEHFLAQRQLIAGHTTNDFEVGSSIWLRVEWVNYQDRGFGMREIEPPTLAALRERAQSGERIQFLTEMAVVEHSGRNSVVVELFGERFTVLASDLIWYPLDPGSITAKDILLPEDKTLLAHVTVLPSGEVIINLRQPFAHKVRFQLSNAVVQARVLRAQVGERGQILLEVDGVRTLAYQRDLVAGAPNDLVPVEPDAWVLVRVFRAEYYQGNPDRQKLLANARSFHNELDGMSIGQEFSATVSYTLDHGFVFNYNGALGYVANSHIAWTKESRARDIFEPNEVVVIYKAADLAQPHPFRVKHVKQIASVRLGERMEAEIQRKCQTGAYLRIEQLLAFVPLTQFQRSQFDDLQHGQPVSVLIEEVNLQRQTIAVRLWHLDAEEANLDQAAQHADEIIDHHYLMSVARFMQQLLKNRAEILPQASADGARSRSWEPFGSLAQSDSRAEQIFVRLLNEARIPCTYRAIRSLLWQLWEHDFLQQLAPHLARYAVANDDCEMVSVLRYAACYLYEIEAPAPADTLIAQSSYALALCTLLPQAPQPADRSFRLRHLLLAYRHDRSIEVHLALLVAANELGLATMRRQLLAKIVEGLAQNLDLLLTLPQPLDIDRPAEERARQVAGFFKPVSALAETMAQIKREILDGKIAAAERKLRDLTILPSVHEFPEIFLNFAICRVFAGDLEGALSYFARAGASLEATQARARYMSARSTYYRLGAYLFYKTGAFDQLLTLLEQGYRNEAALWLQTWLGYLFLAGGQRQLSRAIASATQLSSRSQPEQVLLALYWLEREQPRSTPYPELSNVNALIFRTEGDWPRVPPTIRLLPNDAEDNFERIVQIADDYDVPVYALTRYRRTPSWEAWVGNPRLGAKLCEMALLSGQYRIAHDLANKHFIIRRGTPEAAARVLELCSDLLLNKETRDFVAKQAVARQVARPRADDIIKISESLLRAPAAIPNEKEFSAATILRLLQRWLKQPWEHDQIAQRLADLFAVSPAMQVLVWSRQDLAERLWEVLDTTLDYSWAFETIPVGQLGLEAIEMAALNLLRVGLGKAAETLIEQVRERADLDDVQRSYLAQLKNLAQSSSGVQLQQILQYLLPRTADRRPELYYDVSQRRAALGALALLAQHPDTEIRSKAQLLRAELQLASGSSADAVADYSAVALAGDANEGVRLAAALGLGRLRAQNETVEALPLLVDRAAKWRCSGINLGALIPPLLAILERTESGEQRRLIGHAFERLQRVAEPLISRPWRDVDQVEGVIYYLAQIPDAGSIVEQFYTQLIGTGPLANWSLDRVWALIRPFVDYSFDRDAPDQLAALARALLNETVTFYENRSNLPYAAKNRGDAIAYRQHLDQLIAWLTPAGLLTAPQRIGEVARAVRQHLDSESLLPSSQLLAASRDLMTFLGDDSEHYTDDVRYLLALALLDTDEDRRRDAITGSIRSNELRDQLRLIYAARLLRQENVEGMQQVLQQINNAKISRSVEQAFGLETQGEEPPEQRSRAAETLFSLVPQQRRLAWFAFQGLQRLVDRYGFAVLGSQQVSFLELALKADIPSPVVSRLVSETTQNGGGSGINGTVLVRYCIRQAADRSSLEALLAAIARHELCDNPQIISNELALVSTAEPVAMRRP